MSESFYSCIHLDISVNIIFIMVMDQTKQLYNVLVNEREGKNTRKGACRSRDREQRDNKSFVSEKEQTL